MVPLDLAHFVLTYGYLAVLCGFAIEITGIPFPGTSILLVVVGISLRV